MKISNDSKKSMTKGDEQALIMLAQLDVSKRGRLWTQFDRITIRDCGEHSFRVGFHFTAAAEESAIISDEAFRKFLTEQAVASLAEQTVHIETAIGYVDDVRALALQVIEKLEDLPWQQFTPRAQDAIYQTMDYMRDVVTKCDDADIELNVEE